MSDTNDEIARLTAALEAAEVDRCAKCLNAERRAMEAETRIDRARKILAEGRPEGSAESRLASDLREVLGE